MPGDRVQTINGAEVTNSADVVSQIDQASAGDQVELIVCRHGTLFALTPTLPDSPEWNDVNSIPTGMTVFRPDYDQPMPENGLAMQPRIEELERQVRELQIQLLDLQQTISNATDAKTAATEEPDLTAGAIIRDNE
jgi:hypothetical protein